MGFLIDLMNTSSVFRDPLSSAMRRSGCVPERSAPLALCRTGEGGHQFQLSHGALDEGNHSRSSTIHTSGST